MGYALLSMVSLDGLQVQWKVGRGLAALTTKSTLDSTLGPLACKPQMIDGPLLQSNLGFRHTF